MGSKYILTRIAGEMKFQGSSIWLVLQAGSQLPGGFSLLGGLCSVRIAPLLPIILMGFEGEFQRIHQCIKN
jgi:hypothetical protein